MECTFLDRFCLHQNEKSMITLMLKYSLEYNYIKAGVGLATLTSINLGLGSICLIGTVVRGLDDGIRWPLIDAGAGPASKVRALGRAIKTERLANSTGC